MAGYTTGFLESMAKRLREMPEVEPKERIHSKQESIKYLAKEIAALQKRGYTLDQITDGNPGLGRRTAPPLIAGPRQAPRPRLDSDGTQPSVPRHDGYLARFGLYHERELALSAAGDVLEGTDRIFRKGGEVARTNGRDNVTVRFHLHPDVALFENRRHGLVLAGADGERWEFSCEELAPEVEDSLFFAGIGGARRSPQIVFSFRPSAHPEVYLRFLRL